MIWLAISTYCNEVDPNHFPEIGDKNVASSKHGARGTDYGARGTGHGARGMGHGVTGQL